MIKIVKTATVPKKVDPQKKLEAEERKRLRELQKKAELKEKAAKEPSKKAIKRKEYTCLRCGTSTYVPETLFFKRQNSEQFINNDGYPPYCKTCINEMFEGYAVKYNSYKIACVILCHVLDVPFIEAIYAKMRGKTGDFTMGIYLRQLGLNQYKSDTFIRTILNPRIFRLDKDELTASLDDFVTLSKEDEQNIKDCIEIIGHDPYEGYDLEQRKLLFNDLINYLDEDSGSDAYKLSQIIQIVNNNRQIKEYDRMLSKMHPIQEKDDYEVLSNLKQKLVTANDKIAKENEISVRNRSNKEVGKNTLTYLMRDMRSKNFKNIEVNYYKQLRSQGTQWGANMSLKAIKENCFFDESDRNEIFEIQRKLIEDTVTKLDNEKEENRLLKIKLAEVEKLCQENNIDYDFSLDSIREQIGGGNN
mgnify:CR=1 FL=1